MQIRIHETVQLGDLIAAAFDEAARHTSDPGEATRVATRVVEQLLQRAHRALPPPRVPAQVSSPAASVRHSAALLVPQKDSAE